MHDNLTDLQRELAANPREQRRREDDRALHELHLQQLEAQITRTR